MLFSGGVQEFNAGVDLGSLLADSADSDLEFYGLEVGISEIELAVPDQSLANRQLEVRGALKIPVAAKYVDGQWQSDTTIDVVVPQGEKITFNETEGLGLSGLDATLGDVEFDLLGWKTSIQGFRLTYTDARNRNDSVADATMLSALESTSRLYGISIDSTTDRDFYQFEMPGTVLDSDRLALVLPHSTTGSYSIEIRDSSNAVVGQQTISKSGTDKELKESIGLASLVANGTYTVIVESLDDSVGDYYLGNSNLVI